MAASAEQNTSIEDIMWGYIQQRKEEIRKLRESEIQSQQMGSIDVIDGGKQQKIKLEVNDMYTETDVSYSLGSATGTQEHIKQSESKPDEYASTYVATVWDGHNVSILEESTASEGSDGTEVYGQQLDESKEDKRAVADVEDSLVTEGEHDKVEDKTEMGDIEDSNDSTEAEVAKGTEAVHNESKKAEKSEVADAEDKAEMDDIEDSHNLTKAEDDTVMESVHNESKKAEKSEVSDADAEEGKQSTYVVDNENKVSDAEKTEMGDGEKGDEVIDNSVNVEQLDGNMTDITNDSEGSDLDIDQEEVTKLFQMNKSTDQ